MQPRMSMITLGVDDIEVAIRFYEQGLGFHRIESQPTVAFFDLNGTWLGLFNREELAKDAQVSFHRSEFNSFTIAHNLNSEAEVDEVFAEAIRAGATATKSPQKVFWGGYSGYFKDPDGHLWEIAFNPFEWIGPKD